MSSKFQFGFLSQLHPSAPKAGQQRAWLIVIIGLAVALRLGMAIYLGDEVVVLPGTFDQVSYDMLARQVINGHGLTVAQSWWPATPAGQPTAHWSYLYTFYLAAIYGLFGYHPLIARLLQAVLAGVLIPWLVYRIGKQSFDDSVGLAGAALSAIYIYFIYYAAALMTETFYIIGILWTLDLALRLAQPAPNVKYQWLLLGLALGVTVLLRQVFLLFIPVLFIWLLWRSYRHQSRPLVQMAGILIGATAILVMLILPWTFRNYRAFNTFVLLNTNAGFAFFWGNHPIHGYNFISILPSDGPSYQNLIPADLRHLNEAELDRALLEQGLGFIKADPARYVILSLTRFRDYFKFWPSADSGLVSNVSRVFSFGLLLPFMVYGLIYPFRRALTSGALILYLFAITYTGVHILTWTLIRYRLPVDAVLLVFAAVALVKLQEKLLHRFAKSKTGLKYNAAR